MASKFNTPITLVFFSIAILAAALIQCSVAQRTHVVGDSLGWQIPPGGPVAYTGWASTKTFTVGDILVFNFTTGSHDVAQVSKTSFDGCNGTSPISLINNGPANITLTAAGEHYYICTFSGHCGLGMKLAINVSAASPPPQSGAPAPSSPSASAQTYTVGDRLGWNVPPGGDVAYRTWAANKTFRVGDTLVFNFTSGAHNVAQATSKAAYDSCNASAAETPITTSPARITLTTPGQHFYFCTVPRHCSLGQKLAINVTGTAASAPSPTPGSPATAPTRPPPQSGNSSPASAPVPSSSAGPTPPASGSPAATPPSSGSSPTTPAPSGTTTPSSPSPSGGSAPPPPNAAPSLGVAAALPLTFLSVALAFLY